MPTRRQAMTARWRAKAARRLRSPARWQASPACGQRSPTRWLGIAIARVGLAVLSATFADTLATLADAIHWPMDRLGRGRRRACLACRRLGKPRRCAAEARRREGDAYYATHRTVFCALPPATPRRAQRGRGRGVVAPKSAPPPSPRWAPVPASTSGRRGRRHESTSPPFFFCPRPGAAQMPRGPPRGTLLGRQGATFGIFVVTIRSEP